jgi:hypothetical protein
MFQLWIVYRNKQFIDHFTLFFSLFYSFYLLSLFFIMSAYLHIPGPSTAHQAPGFNFDDKSWGSSRQWTKGNDPAPGGYDEAGNKRQRVSKADAFADMWDVKVHQADQPRDGQFDVELRDWYEVGFYTY